VYAIPGNVARISVEGHWADHIARGSPGGTDFPDGYGTPMRAMLAGVVVMVDNNPAGSGGRTIKIRHADGTFTEEFHAHWITARVGDVVPLRGQVGTSGASGFGVDRYYGPHIHGHGVYPDGRRFDLEPLIDWAHPTNPSGSGSGGGGSSGTRKRALPMYLLLNVIDTKLVMVQGADGRREGVQTPAHLDALIRHRDAMVNGLTMDVYQGDLTGARGAIDWYLGRVNGPRKDPEFAAQLQAIADSIEGLNPDGADFEFSDEDLAKIGAAARPDTAALVQALDDVIEDEAILARLDALKPGATAAEFVAALKAAL
jgi:hypothetical protein